MCDMMRDMSGDDLGAEKQRLNAIRDALGTALARAEGRLEAANRGAGIEVEITAAAAAAGGGWAIGFGKVGDKWRLYGREMNTETRRGFSDLPANVRAIVALCLNSLLDALREAIVAQTEQTLTATKVAESFADGVTNE